MSTPSPSNRGTAIVVAIVALFLIAVAGVVAIFIAVPEGSNPGAMATVLLGSLATTIAAVVAVAKVGALDDKVDDLGNGRMDAKLRAAVADVLDPDLHREGMSDQLAVDRARRAAGYQRRGRNRPITVDQPADTTTTGDDLA